MSERDLDTTQPRVVYTCWPCGPGAYAACGVLLIVAGTALITEVLFPDSAQIVWGAGLLLVGLWIAVRALQGHEPW